MTPLSEKGTQMLRKQDCVQQRQTPELVGNPSGLVENPSGLVKTVLGLMRKSREERKKGRHFLKVCPKAIAASDCEKQKK